MSQLIRQPNQSKIASKKIEGRMKAIRSVLKGTGDLYSAIVAAFNSIWGIAARLKGPSLEPRYLIVDSDPDPEDWNLNLQAIEEDLSVLFGEEANIRSVAQDVSHLAEASGREIEQYANLANSKLTDLRLASGQLGQDVLVAGDDFNDTDKVDLTFPTTLPLADIDTLQGVATLKRASITNVISENDNVEITPSEPADLQNPGTNFGRMPTPENLRRFYEGNFYATVGQARPEGGNWHLEERVRPGVVVAGDSLSTISIRPGEIDDSVFDQFPDLRNELDRQRAEGISGGGLSPEDIVVLERGASLTELVAARRRMLDSNPDSFWESEFVVQATPLSEMIFARENTGQQGETIESVRANVTPQELRALAASSAVDKDDFVVTIVISLSRRRTTNFITINPMNFGETAWYEVLDVSTSEDESGAFVPVDDFAGNGFEKILTDEANEEVSEGVAAMTMAPNRYSFRGVGVFSFAPREALRIRVRIRQSTPVPAPYERMVVQLTRTLTLNETSAHGSCFAVGTYVATPSGSIPIHQINVGDTVYSFDPVSLRLVHSKVTKVSAHSPKPTVSVRFDDGSTVRGTAQHRVWADSGWTKLGNLQVGSLVVSPTNEAIRRVTRITPHPPECVFNLLVTGPRNYLANGVVARSFNYFPRLRSFLNRLIGR